MFVPDTSTDHKHRPRCARKYCPVESQRAWSDTSELRRYLVNRYYDPATAQFISVDPLVSMTGEPFSYAGDDPVNESDPSGMSGDALADEQYDVQHSCKGQYAHAQGCGQQWYQPACSLLSGIAQGVAHVDSEAYNGAFNTYERLFGALEAAYYQAKWGMDLDDALLFDALSGLAEVGSNPEDDQIAVIVVIIVLG